jgi:hypothetical protein
MLYGGVKIHLLTQKKKLEISGSMRLIKKHRAKQEY